MTIVDNTFHHVELHTVQPEQLLELFMSTYGFHLIAKRATRHYDQWLLKSGQCQLLISSVCDAQLDGTAEVGTNDYDILTPILNNESSRSWVVNRDTTFNVAMHVKSVPAFLANNPDVQVNGCDDLGLVTVCCSIY